VAINRDDAEERLAELIANLELRREIVAEQSAWLESVHDPESVAEIYDRLIGLVKK
jgi:hypothetical protein